MREIEGDKVFGDVTREMLLVSDLVIPAKFKTLDFDKYRGHSCPESYMIMYYQKTEAYIENDKLMIHYFQDNLNDTFSK